MIRFLHQQRETAVEAIDADTSILDYLREHKGLMGTKEGCASGDCGACTVVVVNAGEEGLEYVPVNACIAPLGSLHGKSLLTVEDLKDGETWHPVQRAMIENHASQCGFCTPGFVMSLFALYHQPPPADRQNILEALGGNLCRCTGYRPIIAAAEQALDSPADDQFTRAAPATLDRLWALSETDLDVTGLTTSESHYLRPGSADATALLLSQYPQARLIAGGTDLMLEHTQQLKRLGTLIDLRAVPEFAEVEVDSQYISLGAAVTHRRSQKAVLSDYPELAELIERFGSLQIRSQGTVVGNIANASPIGDWPPALLALDAQVCLQSVDGQRTLNLDDFFIDYRRTALATGEFIRCVQIPRRTTPLHLRAFKISKRFDDDISSVCGVFALHMEGDQVSGARVAFGGMAALPRRSKACEAALEGLDLRRHSLADALQALDADFEPISDARASALYRRTVAGKLLERLQQDFQGVATRVHEHHVPAYESGAAAHE